MATLCGDLVAQLLPGSGVARGEQESRCPRVQTLDESSFESWARQGPLRLELLEPLGERVAGLSRQRDAREPRWLIEDQDRFGRAVHDHRPCGR